MASELRRYSNCRMLDILRLDGASLDKILAEAIRNLVDDDIDNPCKDPMEKRKLSIELTFERGRKSENIVFVDYKVTPKPAPYSRLTSSVPDGQMSIYDTEGVVISDYRPRFNAPKEDEADESEEE